MKYKSVGLLILAACAAFAQSREIEVATIKLAEFPSEPYFQGFTYAGTCSRPALMATGNRVNIPVISVCGLIRAAYEIQGYRVLGLPKALTEAVRSNFFSIQVQAEGGGSLTQEDTRALVRQLLEERFQLKFHWETRELPVYTLHVARNGPKMPTQDLENCDPFSLIQTKAVKGARATLNCKANLTMAQFADSLTLEADRPVIDRTALTDKYVVQLVWSSDGEGGAPSLFTAVQEQLGLKLEAEKAPVEILVVDQMTRPSEN